MDAKTCLQKLQYVGVLAFATVDEMVAVSNILLGYRDGPAPHDKPRKEGRIVRI